MTEPNIPVEELLKLGVPNTIIESLRKNGIHMLRKFQYDAIRSGMQGNSLLIVAPTGSGKTLVGEVLSITKIIKNNAIGLYLTPYKSLSEEIKTTFQSRYPFIRVGIATGDYRDVPIGLLGTYDLIILTYEKTDHILREHPRWLKRVGIVVIDEIHMLGDPSRGAVLDIVLTSFKERKYQLIGLSATIRNPESISEWLNARLIKSSYRPVKLLECVYYTRKNEILIYDPNPAFKEKYLVKEQTNIANIKEEKGTLDYFLKNAQEFLSKFEVIEAKSGFAQIKERKFQKTPLSQELESIFRKQLGQGKIFSRKPLTGQLKIKPTSFMNALLILTSDTILESKIYGQSWQLLIFRASRSLAQKTAQNIASFIKRFNLLQEDVALSEELRKIMDTESKLFSILQETLKYRVAFHHAGLSREVRQFIEDKFRSGDIRVLIATPTLAAGVNLPARRVVIEEKYYDPSRGEKIYISVSEYKQRGGRAGRPGLDIVGETYLIARSKDQLLEFFEKFIFGSPEPAVPVSGMIAPIVYSQVLALITLKKSVTTNEILEFFDKTFFVHYYNKNQDYYSINLLRRNIYDALQFLKDNNLIQIEENKQGAFKPTNLGIRVSKLYLKPTSAKPLLDILKFWKNSRIRSLSPRNINEALYAISSSYENFAVLRRLLSNLDELELLITENQEIINMLQDLLGITHPDELFYLRTLEDEEFLASLAGTILLNKWIRGERINHIIERFIPSFGLGDFHEFIRVSSWLAYCLAELSSVMRLNPRITEKLRILEKQIRYGVPEDLLVIVENVEGVGRIRAMALKAAGFDTLEKIARANVSMIVRIPGFGEKLAQRLIEFARSRIKREIL